VSTLDDEEQIVITAPCIRCGILFMSNPYTVPSAPVHPVTRCPIRPDGTRVNSGDPDAVREPLCTPCAYLFRLAGGADRPLSELFPYARVELIDRAAARANQGGNTP